MVRVAGIDKDFTPLELMFHQASEEEKLNLAAQYLANLTLEIGEYEMKVTLESDTVIKISASKD